QLLTAMSPDNEGRYPVPTDVAKAVEHALFDPNPKLRYLTAPSAAQTSGAIRRAIEKVVELNEGQSFRLDRAALVALLDSAPARPGPAGTTGRLAARPSGKYLLSNPFASARQPPQ